MFDTEQEDMLEPQNYSPKKQFRKKKKMLVDSDHSDGDIMPQDLGVKLVCAIFGKSHHFDVPAEGVD